MISIHKDAEFIINMLNSRGYEAFAVGGCVRDAIMQRPCDDTDVTTNALPEETKSVFSAYPVIETGIKHGTVGVLINGKIYEVTTYRKESAYSDSRHPDNVSFVTDLKEDLSRRDFTINAIAFSGNSGIRDYFGGIKDINNKIIRTVGDPYQRFSEDALRILRALRFSAVLGFEIEQNTSKAINDLAETVNKVSGERIFTELKKLLCGKNAQLVVNNYINAISKMICANGEYTEISRLPTDFQMRLACLCGSGIDITLQRLRADNDTKHTCKLLVNSIPIPTDEAEQKLYISSLGRNDARNVVQYRRALYNEDRQGNIEKIIDSNTPLFLSDLAINGKDLLNIGINGKEIGKTLELLLLKVIKKELANEKQALLEWYKK